MGLQPLALELMALLDAPGVGPSRVRRLLRKRETSGQWNLTDRAFLLESLTESQVDAIPRSRERAERQWTELHEQGIEVVSLVDPRYPSTLHQLLGDASPVILLCRGNLGLLDKIGVGFCGSREATDKGISTARATASQLAKVGVNVVSGYATGVDMAAHSAALEADGTTSIILAEGILRFRVKREIRALWDDRRTLVVSEFGANLPWSVSHAMTRNRTICGLSRALVLIEAKATGGSIQAGRDALRLQLPLFAAVYEGMPESATGNQELLREGAHSLMRSRASGLPNVAPVLNAVHSFAPRPNGSPQGQSLFGLP